MDRRDIGSWLQGPKATLSEQGIEFGYVGERLGFPEVGPNSVARMGRRLIALCIDWFASMAVAGLIFPAVTYNTKSLLILVIFALQVFVLTTLTGSSFGQRILKIRIINISGSRLSMPRVLVRTLLLCWVIPALIWDRDGRGLHDRAVASVAVRIR
ncbi:MAG: RDD family protein [Actinomycetes bacterium]